MSRAAQVWYVGPVNWVSIGAALASVGVLLGAFGAHALRARVAPEALKTWETATFYLFTCAFGLLALGLLERAKGGNASGSAKYAGVALLSGGLLFSGSLYVFVLGGPRGAAMVTPLGGLLMIAGWALFAWYAR